MSEETHQSQSPQQIREALAANIPEAFASRKKPAWARSRKHGDKLLRKWEEYFSPYFVEHVKPLVSHKERDEIPFDVLRAVEAMEPGFWWHYHEWEADRFYMLPTYLRGMLLAPEEMDVAFGIWLDHLLPLTYPEERKLSSQLSFFNGRNLHQRLADRSQRLEQYLPEERAFIAAFFRNFAAMYPGERLSEHKMTLAIAENFWDGVYWEPSLPEDER